MEAFQHFIQLLIDNLHDHGVKISTALALAVIGWFLGMRQARQQWRKQEFLDRVNFTLTRIENGTLKIRTLVEKSLDDVMLNKYASQMLIKQAHKTTAKDPLIRFAKEDAWNYMNPALNELSELFAEGHIRKDLGLPVTSGQYIMALTNEKAGPVRTHKIRVMIFHKNLITNLPAEIPKFTSPSHSTRWETLCTLAQSYKTEPHFFQEVELTM
jgi:hypothetical protein